MCISVGRFHNAQNSCTRNMDHIIYWWSRRRCHRVRRDTILPFISRSWKYRWIPSRARGHPLDKLINLFSNYFLCEISGCFLRIAYTSFGYSAPSSFSTSVHLKWMNENSGLFFAVSFIDGLLKKYAPK